MKDYVHIKAGYIYLIMGNINMERLLHFERF